jgi:phage FluMu gp28-like protein
MVTGYEPTEYQKRFLLDQTQFVVARWARQTGKSLTLSVFCLFTVLTGSNRGVAILAPSLRQGRILIRRIGSFLPKLPKSWVDGRILKTRLSFANGSVIEAFPNSPETVRGLTLQVLIVDEANYVEDDKALYDAVIYALATTNGRFIATSTPGTRDSLFYEMCTNDVEYGDFSRHHVSFHDALEPKGPLKKVIVDKLKRQTREDPSRWDREMLAEFSSDEEAWLSYGLIDSCVDESLAYVGDLNRPDSEAKQN